MVSTYLVLNSRSLTEDNGHLSRQAKVAQLFYHTTLCLLAQMHPKFSYEVEEMAKVVQDHSRQICGIIVHVKDRGVASASLHVPPLDYRRTVRQGRPI
jgi:hypothetical protein